MIDRNPENARRRELAMIHIAKDQLGMADEAYRAILWTIARVDSAADLDWAGRKQLLDHLKKCGFKPTAPRRAGDGDLPQDEQSKMIRALWLELHQAGVVRDPSERALNHWVKRMTGVERLAWCRPPQRASLIEMLKKWNDRPRR
jgi:phage gp16-like protein